MHVSILQEAFPEIGTVENPAVFYDGRDAFVCYEASIRSGGGNVVLKFEDVIELRKTPINVEGLRECRYPVNPWAFNEVNHLAISPTCLPGSSTAIQTAKLMTFYLGPMLKSPKPYPWPENTAYNMA